MDFLKAMSCFCGLCDGMSGGDVLVAWDVHGLYGVFVVLWRLSVRGVRKVK